MICIMSEEGEQIVVANGDLPCDLICVFRAVARLDVQRITKDLLILAMRFLSELGRLLQLSHAESLKAVRE